MSALTINTQIPLPLLQQEHSFAGAKNFDEDSTLDLSECLAIEPSNSYYCVARGEALLESGIYDGDILLVNSRVQPQHQQIVVASIDEELVCRKLDLKEYCLRSDSDEFECIYLTEHANCQILGVVTQTIRQLF